MAEYNETVTVKHIAAMLSVLNGDNVNDWETKNLLVELKRIFPKFIDLILPRDSKEKRTDCWARMTDEGKQFLLETFGAMLYGLGRL